MKLPLCVYVIKHPEFDLADEYVHAIYSSIFREYNSNCNITCGVPVFFSESTDVKDNMLNIDFEIAERTAIFVLVDTSMLLDKEYGWKEYLNYISKKCQLNENRRLFPIAIVEQALQAYPDIISNLNYIRLYKLSNEMKLPYLIFSIKHDLCRMMFRIEKASESSSITEPPVKLFLSHAKADGIDIVERIRTYINSSTAIVDFFDTVDIPQGSDFLKEIDNNIRQSSMLLVIQTDKYTKSEWCKKEILLAKEKRIPIVIINCLKKGEERSFPYIGNLRNYCGNMDDKNFELNVLSGAMSEVLSKSYYKENVFKVLQENKLSISKENIFEYPPELLSLEQWPSKNHSMIVYPEPPLGKFELELLQIIKPNHQLVTMTMLPSISFGKNLLGKKIGISVSESKTQYKDGISTVHCEGISIDIARYLLYNQADLCYGGDINYSTKFNFTTDLINMIEMYSKETDCQKKLINYIAGYLEPTIKRELQLELINKVDFIFCKHSNFLSEDENELNKQVNKAIDLSNMRELMISNCDARIAMGGKSDNFSGCYPGILEEVMISLGKKKPLYLLGGFGGITSEIINCILGEENCLSNGTLKSRNENSDFIKYYNSVIGQDHQRVDYEAITKELQNLKISQLNNGLTEDENKVLFKSKNVYELISLILKGLNSKL